MVAIRQMQVWGSCLAALAIGLIALLGASQWPGTVFPGFLILDNGVVASAGLAHWPATRDGEIFQKELVAANGVPIRSVASLREQIAELPAGVLVEYDFRDSDASHFQRHIATRNFDAIDFWLLFGPFILTGSAFLILALVVRILRGDDSLAVGIWACSLVLGIFGLTAMDLYGPARLFRIHALAEALTLPAGVHMALVFPQRARIAKRFPRLIPGLYAATLLFIAYAQAMLYDPAAYVQTHGIAVAGLGISMIALIGTQIRSYLSPASFEARQRVRVVAFGASVALAPIVALSVASVVSDGSTSQNMMAFSAALFPVAIGYAALRHNLFEVDAMIRRSVSYAVLTIAIGGVYASLLAAFETVLGDAFAQNRTLLGIAVAAICVGLLLPLRDQVQSVVDRLFFRTAYDYGRVLEDTSQRLASVTDLATIQHELESAVGTALHAEFTALLVERHIGLGFEAIGPASNRGDVVDRALQAGSLIEFEDRSLAIPFAADERVVAVLHLGRPLSGKIYGGEDRRLLTTLANQGAVAVQNALALEEVEELNRGLERKVGERTQELSDALTELQKTQAQLVHGEKMASVGRFVAGIAHELNNPLNFVMGNIHYLREYIGSMLRVIDRFETKTDELTEASRADVLRVIDEVELGHVRGDLESVFEGCAEGISRASTLVRDLRTFSRLDQASLASTDLHESLDTTLNLLRGRLPDEQIIRDYGDLPLVECLADQLNQVFMNLCVNAIDAMDLHGKLTVRTRALGADRVQIEIEDTGSGIDAEAVDRIFDPFFTTKEVGKGTGLGLSISYGIITRHAGMISVRSEAGVGTCFCIELPVNFEGEPEDTPLDA